MVPWYIDAIDPRAGLAVASRRVSDLGNGDGRLGTGPVIFVGPPDFVPEFLDSRATGFGLARGSGQIGLFIDRVEVAFDSADAVAEFVRRTYLRGSSGDGPGESGGSPPPPGLEPGPSPELGDLETGHTDNDPVARLIEFALQCAEGSKGLGSGYSTKKMTTLLPPVVTGGSVRLVRGAKRTVLELLKRRPTPDNLAWVVSAQRLTDVLRRMGLVFFPFDQPSVTMLNWLRGYLRPENPRPVDAFPHDLLWEYPDWPYLGTFCGTAPPSADPFEDLAFLPTTLLTTPEGGDNLQALLSAVIATPADILCGAKGGSPEALGEVALFAACYLVLGTDRSIATHCADRRMWPILADDLVERGMRWMSDNLPRMVFNEPVEGLVVSASELVV